MRTGKELILVTRPFAEEDRGASYRALASTFALLAAAQALAAAALPEPVRLAAAVLAGLTIARAFILYHDYHHGAILRDSAVAGVLLWLFGLFVLAPPRVWRQTHNYHHAHTAQITGSQVGSFVTLTTEMWSRTPRRERLLYRIIRHPLNIAAGVVTVFVYGMCVSSFLRNPRRHWDSLLALVFHAALAAGIIVVAGVGAWLHAVVLPLALACGFGAYLFYAQHNFPGMNIQPRVTWDYARAALESSSYMRTGRVMGWFTGDIGYHHVHHLNPSIPFYRLAETMANLPELQTPRTTSLRPRDVVACFRQNLWDAEAGRMVTYREARDAGRRRDRAA